MPEENLDICKYCMTKGILRMPAEETSSKKDIYVCDSCWKLLQDPKTALQLIRGQITLALRGTVPEPVLNMMLQKFMDEISTWKPRN